MGLFGWGEENSNSNAQGFVARNGIKYTSFLQQDSQKIILYLYRYFYGPLPRDISLNNIHYNLSI